jgi:hypothetical protein
MTYEPSACKVALPSSPASTSRPAGTGNGDQSNDTVTRAPAGPRSRSSAVVSQSSLKDATSSAASRSRRLLRDHAP